MFPQIKPIQLYTAIAFLISVLIVSAGPVHADDPTVLFQSDGNELIGINKVVYSNNITGFLPTIGPELQIGVLPDDWGLSVIHAHTGTNAIRFSGSANGGASTFCCMDAFTVTIPVTASTKLTYWIYPQQENARYEKVDLHCSDGTTLHSLGGIYNFTETTAAAHQPGQIPINAWSKITCDVGQILKGKTIDAVWIVYDQAGSHGQFRGYIDDITVTGGG